MSAIREGIRGTSRSSLRRTRRDLTLPPGKVRRGGLLDLIAVAVVVFAIAGRTPVGGLLWYGLERARGHEAELPTLTAYFSSGATWTPPEDAFPVVLPSEDNDWIPPGGIPEPQRTAVRTVLNGTPLSASAKRQLAAHGHAPDAAGALAYLDAQWGGDLEGALVSLTIGPELRDRAVARARAAGEQGASRYEVHRRYLPGGSARDADRLVNGTLSLAKLLDLQWPIEAEHHVTSPWGDRMHPVLGERRFHNGVDLSVPVGTPVLAAQAGRIAVVGEDAASGRFVVIDHGNGVRTSYCHLSETPLRRGTEVARGQTVAASGNTGRSTGPHLHFVVRIAGSTVDPERFHRAPET